MKLLEVDGRKELPDALPARALLRRRARRRTRAPIYYSKQTPEGPRVFRHRIGSDVAADEQALRRRLRAGEDHRRRALRRRPLPAARRLARLGGRRRPRSTSRISPERRTDHADRQRRRRRASPPSIAGDRHVPADQLGRAERPDPRGRPARSRARELEGRSSPRASPPSRTLALAGDRLFVRYLENVRPEGPDLRRRRQAVGRDRVSRDRIGRQRRPASGARTRRSSRTSPSSSPHDDLPLRRPAAGSAFGLGAASRSRSRATASRSSRSATRRRTARKIPMFLVHRKGLPRDGKQPDAPDRLRRLHAVADSRPSPRARRSGSSTAASTPSPTCAAAASSARPGTRPACSRRSRTSSTTSSAAAEWLIANKYTSTGEARDLRRLERRPARRRGADAAARSLPRRRLQLSAARHAALPQVPRRGLLGAGVRLVRRPDAVPVPLRLLAVSPRASPAPTYPAVLFITGDSDTRVAPLHARKMTALLQADSADQAEQPILLLLRHEGRPLARASTRRSASRSRTSTTEMQFLFWQLGMAPAAAQPVKKAA